MRREQARNYRAVVNGRLSSDEGAQIYMLREVRASLEAELPNSEIRGGYVARSTSPLFRLTGP